jgi:hypothetical protein
MSKKDRILYNGLGFPVIIIGAKTYEFRGERLPKINHGKLNASVFRALMESRWRLTGNQLNFIRGYMGLSQKMFADRLGFDSHATISGWLKKGDEASGMNPAVELAVRMLMAHHLNSFDVVNENAPLILSEIEESRPEVAVAA